jgi:hypothetical protein
MEATAVHPAGRITPACAGIWKDEHIAPMKAINDYLHLQGAMSGLQLAHVCIYISYPMSFPSIYRVSIELVLFPSVCLFSHLITVELANRRVVKRPQQPFKQLMGWHMKRRVDGPKMSSVLRPFHGMNTIGRYHRSNSNQSMLCTHIPVIWLHSHVK